MNGGEVFSLFRSFADESDSTFLTDAQATTYLEQGYREFRNMVASIDPSIFLKRAIVSGNGVNDYIDLSATVPAYLGPTAAAGTKIDRLLRVGRVTTATADLIVEYLDSSPNELAIPRGGYVLAGNRLILSGIRSDSYRLEYIPTFSFAGVFASGSVLYIDDLESFHILIPLLGMRYYAIRDGGTSPEIERQILFKVKELEWFLSEGRNQGSRYVLTADNNF
tara:strand:+ start:7931 stop:8596 length:666 start_codon:yes stop_codon:yes gene_type:complete